MYKQPVDNVAGRVHTSNYRIHGTLFPRPHVGIPDQLNRADQHYLPIASPKLYRDTIGDIAKAERMVQGEFIAVPRDSIHWVVGGDAGNSDFRDFRWREVAVLFGDVLLRGKLRVGAGMRTSDYIRGRVEAKPFDALFDVTTSLLQGGAAFDHLDIVESFAFATVNLRVTTGVVELGSVFDEMSIDVDANH